MSMLTELRHDKVGRAPSMYIGDIDAALPTHVDAVTIPADWLSSGAQRRISQPSSVKGVRAVRIQNGKITQVCMDVDARVDMS